MPFCCKNKSDTHRQRANASFNAVKGKFQNINGALKFLKYNNYPFMLKLPQQHQLIHQKIKHQSSLTELTNQETQFYHLNACINNGTDQGAKMSQFAKKLHNSTLDTNKSCVQKAQNNQTEQESLPQSEANAQNLSSKSKGRSVFQNFQKHLITTLKTGIVLQQNYRNDPTIHLAQRMWQTFLQTTYHSKKILHFLFGVKSIIDLHLQPTVHPNFYPIASVYPKEEIELAQEYLREQIVRQGYKLKDRNLLKNRRMRNGQQFYLYFQKFMQQLQSGGISRRLSKQLKNSDWKHTNIRDYEG